MISDMFTVLIGDSEGDGIPSPFLVYDIRNLPEAAFALFKPGSVMVTDDIPELCLCHVSFHIDQVVEPFIAVCVPWRFMFREKGIDLHGDQEALTITFFADPG